MRPGLTLVQSEWNTLRMGNPKYGSQCKLVRFKTIYIESVETGVSVPLMTDGKINVSKNSFIRIFFSKIIIAGNGHDAGL